MAIIYTISGQQFEIGSGFSSQGAAESPAIVNPFPFYSISREFNSTGDDSHLGNKYNISITGRLIVPSSVDATVDGERQNELHKQMIWHLQTLSAQSHNLGKLEIIPFGGQDKPFIFLDARLRNIQFPQQNEQSLGVQYAEYVFEFEAYSEASNNNLSFSLKIASAQESWELNLNDDNSFSPGSDGTPYKTYTLTHTVSANGLKSINSDATDITPAWKNAAQWVKTRLISNLGAVITSDVSGNTDRLTTYFRPQFFDSSTSTTSPDLSSYTSYNHIRVPSCDMAEGSYSVTETWFLSNMPATIDMDIEVNEEESGTITMTLTGTITGLDSSAVNSNAINKISNAESVLSNINSKAYDILSPYYPSNTGGFALQNTVRQKTIGRNKGKGIITFSYTYNDNPVFITGAISSNFKIRDFNLNKNIQTIAIIPVIARAAGPIIQNMNTTPESKRSLDITVTMGRNHRANKPDLSSFYSAYQLTDSYITAFEEEWEPYTGNYTLNLEWTKE